VIDTLYKVVAFAITLGVLVVFHELGHYVVARLAGVKVLRFSVGFGRMVWSRRYGRDGTEWALSAIPLGGYVKMADEREAHVDLADVPRAFNRQSVWRRIAIVAAGYADGVLRAAAAGGFRLAGGMPLVGRVSMDMLAIDVTDAGEVEVGQDIELFGAATSINDLAAAAGTIPYEVLTRISTRAERVYLGAV